MYNEVQAQSKSASERSNLFIRILYNFCLDDLLANLQIKFKVPNVFLYFYSIKQRIYSKTLHFVIIISSFCIKLNYEIFVFCFTNIKGSDKLQFVCLIGGLIGGRVFNPRQQHALGIYL